MCPSGALLPKSEDTGEGVMSTPVGELFRQASELNEHDRATLAGLLLESLEHEVDESVESAWQEEIERRLAEIDTDSVQLVPWDEVKAKLMRRMGAERPD
jgi:putative addiction module component (TIGR02574 family)